MKSFLKSAHTVPSALVAGMMLVPFAAQADFSKGDAIGKTEAEIRQSLQSEGYVVIEIEMEDDEVEAEVTLNGAEFEIEIDPVTGKIAKIEKED